MLIVVETYTCECGREIKIEMDINEPDTLWKCKECGRSVVGYIGSDFEDGSPYIGIVSVETKSVEDLKRQSRIVETEI